MPYTRKVANSSIFAKQNFKNISYYQIVIFLGIISIVLTFVPALPALSAFHRTNGSRGKEKQSGQNFKQGVERGEKTLEKSLHRRKTGGEGYGEQPYY